MGRARRAVVVAAVLLAVGFSAIALAAGTTLARPAAPDYSAYQPSDFGMEGITEVYVLVEGINQEWKTDLAISEGEIKTQVELYLRKVPGLRVTDDLTAPTVYVQVTGDTIHEPSGRKMGQAAWIELRLMDRVVVARGNRMLVVRAASIWETGTLLRGPGGFEQRKDVEDTIVRLLDAFQNGYLKANPQGK